MSELGGLDIGAPGEGQSGAPEQLSEEAKQRFAAAAAAMQQIRREEKKAKKRDDKVAQIIVEFLGNKNHAHLFVLISRLVARDCPSIFILSILSLIHDASRTEVQDYLREMLQKTEEDMVQKELSITASGELDAGSNKALIDWITRMQMTLSVGPEKILLKLMIDGRNIDGTVLQLSTFVLQEFFGKNGKAAPFEKLQPLTAGILQTVFEPFLPSVRRALQEQAQKQKKEDA